MSNEKRSPPSLIRRLRSGVSITLVVKLMLLVALYVLCFSPSQRPDVDAAAIAQRIFLAR